MNDYHDLSSLADKLSGVWRLPLAQHATLKAAVDQLNILVFGVDHRASDKVNTDLAEVYREALESIYSEAWNGELPYILQILQNVPGLIPEEEEQAVTDTIKSRLSAND